MAFVDDSSMVGCAGRWGVDATAVVAGYLPDVSVWGDLAPTITCCQGCGDPLGDANGGEMRFCGGCTDHSHLDDLSYVYDDIGAAD